MLAFTLLRFYPKPISEGIEIIVVDDGSTDKTLQCAREFAEKWSCIEVFTKKNEGVGTA